MMRAFFIVVLFAALFSSGCEKLSGRMSSETFEKYYIDMVIMQDSLGKDMATTQQIFKELDKRYNVSRKEYEATFEYYQKDPQRWDVFFKNVEKRILTLQQPNSTKKP